jgi:hypothetical protein
MLTIKDISASKELDVKAMSEVRGGGDVFSTNVQGSSQNASAGLVAVNESTQNLFSSNTAFDYKDIQKTLVAIGQNSGLGVF